MGKLANKLFFYDLWMDSGPRIITVSLRSLDGWDGIVKADMKKWNYQRIDKIGVKSIIKMLGSYDKDNYGYNIKIYSMDTGKFYSSMDELQEDLYVKMLAGV